jgi:ribokinase
MIDLISYLDRMPQQGETVFGADFAQGFGGKGANQAVMAALLGAEVSMVNTVGSDLFGRETIANFQAFGVDTEFIEQVEGTHSGVANILVENDGSNRIVLGAGANSWMTQAQVDRAFTAHPTPDVVLSQLEVPQPIIRRTFNLAKASQAITVLNPGPAAAVDPEIVASTDWLIPNESEFALLYEAEYGRHPGDYAADAAALAKQLDVRLVITLGAAGANYIREDGRVQRFEAPAVQAIDTTGAGDAFCGSFAYAIAAGWSADEAISLAVAVSSDSVARRGTQTSYPRGDDLAVLIHRHRAQEPGTSTRARTGGAI